MIAWLPILFAVGLNEIVSVLVGLAFFVIWLVNQINDAKKKQLAQEQRAQAAMPPIEPAAAPPMNPLRAQVDEFLRRAGGHPAPDRPVQLQPPANMQAGTDVAVLLLDEPVAKESRKSLAETMRSQSDAATTRRAKSASSREQRLRSPRRAASQQRPQSVAEHVADHVGAATQEFRQEVADLGERVRQADEQFDAQLHQKFDHELGSLAAHRPTSASDQPPTAERAPFATPIATLLASPEGVRQAIVLNEILRRPEDRW